MTAPPSAGFDEPDDTRGSHRRRSAGREPDGTKVPVVALRGSRSRARPSGSMLTPSTGGGTTHEDPDCAGLIASLGAGTGLRGPHALAGGQPRDRAERAAAGGGGRGHGPLRFHAGRRGKPGSAPAPAPGS